MGKTARGEPHGGELVAGYATQLWVLAAELEGARCPREKCSSCQRCETNQREPCVLCEASQRRIEERRRVRIDRDPAHKHRGFCLKKHATDRERETRTAA